MRAREWLLDLCFAPVPAARLDLFQRVFVATFLLYVAAWSQWGAEWLTDFGFHVSAEATSPSYPPPLPALPRAWLAPFLIALFATGGAALLRLGGRATMAMLAGFAIYVQMVDQPASFTLNKLYVVFFVLLALQPASKVFVDETGMARRFVSAWPVRVVQAHLLVQYCTAGICKVAYGDWLEVPNILFGHSVGFYRTDLASLAAHYLPAEAWIVLSATALAFELGAPLLFLIRRLRPVAIVVGIGMHLSIALLMADLIYFSLQMITFYLFFLPTSWVVAAEDRISSALRSLTARTSHQPGRASTRSVSGA